LRCTRHKQDVIPCIFQAELEEMEKALIIVHDQDGVLLHQRISQRPLSYTWYTPAGEKEVPGRPPTQAEQRRWGTPFPGFVRLLREERSYCRWKSLFALVTRRAEALSHRATSQRLECGVYKNGEPVGAAGRDESDC